MGEVLGGLYGPTSVLPTNDFVLVFGWTYKTKTFEYDKNLQKYLKRKNACTSYQGHPTEYPLVVLNLDLLKNPTQHTRSHQPSTFGFEASQRKYHCTSR
jgi:hypothetical protein